MTDFQGKVAIVTGASGFLASGIVPLLHDTGAKLVLVANNDKLYERMPNLQDSEQHLNFPSTDLTDPSIVDQVVQSTIDNFGRIDILINIVGGWDAGKPVHETSVETWDNMMLLNSKITFLMCRATIPYMLEHKSGKIVNIGARPGIRASGQDAAYAASKAAVLRLTESLSHEYKKEGLNINAILPSMIVSEERFKDEPDAGVTPQQLANVIAFLCSDESRIIHGAAIPAYGTRF